mmetsp:Transcript_11977/g.33156  ORF Transcript_11977/g.33156 Transcript_11977/m.33156 type:complete len:134 (+) Transcript_11977:702-1103(+)
MDREPCTTKMAGCTQVNGNTVVGMVMDMPSLPIGIRMLANTATTNGMDTEGMNGRTGECTMVDSKQTIGKVPGPTLGQMEPFTRANSTKDFDTEKGDISFQMDLSIVGNGKTESIMDKESASGRMEDVTVGNG